MEAGRALSSAFPVMVVPVASWQNERVPDWAACWAAALISPLRVEAKSESAVARSDDEMVMPFEAAYCSASRSPTWMFKMALA